MLEDQRLGEVAGETVMWKSFEQGRLTAVDEGMTAEAIKI